MDNDRAGDGNMKKLGTLLQEANVIDEIQLIRALSHQRKWRCRLGHSLIELGYVTEEIIAKTVANQLGIQYIELNPGATPRELFSGIPKQLAGEKKFFPAGYSQKGADKKVVIAFCDPTDTTLIDAISGMVGAGIEMAVARESVIDTAVQDWDKWATTNPPSAPESHLSQSPDKMTSELDKIEEADVVEPEKMPTEKAPISSGTEPIEPLQVESESSSLASDVLLGGGAQAFSPDKPDAEILSVKDLPPIDDDLAPEIVTSEPWEHIMPGGSHGVSEAPETGPEGFISPPHEQIESQPVEDADAAVEIDHSSPWEHAMPDGGKEPELQEMPQEESFITPAYEQLESTFEGGADEEGVDIPIDELAETGEPPVVETFVKSTQRPNDAGNGLDIKSLENLIPSTTPPEGESLHLPPEEPEALPQEALTEIPGQADKAVNIVQPAAPPPSSTEQAAEPPKSTEDIWQLRPQAREQLEGETKPAAPEEAMTNAEITREIKQLREDVLQLSTMLEALVKKTGKN